jgi:hypothetical protein
LAGAIGNAGIDASNVMFIAPPSEALMIKLRAGLALGDNVFPTLGLPAKTVAAFSPSAIFSGTADVPQIETGEQVAIHRNTVPLEIVDAGGTKAAPTTSFWQQELIGVRVRLWASFAVATGGAALVNNVIW